jgi:hypothetical protein
MKADQAGGEIINSGLMTASLVSRMWIVVGVRAASTQASPSSSL